MERLRKIFHKLFSHEIWMVGISPRPIHDFLHGCGDKDIRWLFADSSRTFVADPFGIYEDGELKMLYEKFDYVKFRGTINAAIFKNGKMSEEHENVLELEGHASYPFLLKHEGNYYCVPETLSANEIALYRAVDFPRKWEKAAVLVSGFAGVDPTLFKHEGSWWLLASDEKDDKNSKLFAWYAKNIEGPYFPHAKNPIKCDIRSGRSGGTPFAYDGKLYRPSQDCSLTYGGAVTICRIDKLTKDEFKEEIVTTIRPGRNGRYRHGMHTISGAGSVTLVDAKRHVFSFAALSGKMRKKLLCKPIGEHTGKVLVLGEDTRSFLGVIRSLGRKGVQVHVAWCLEDSIALSSRYVAKYHRLPVYSPDSDVWKSAFKDLLGKEKFDLVVPCNDQSLIPLQKHKEELGRYARLYTLSDEAFETAFSKTRSYELAVELGIRVARSKIVSDVDQSTKISGDLKFPLIVKPQASFAEDDLSSRHNVKKASDEAELRTHLSSMLQNGPVLVQQYFSGIGIGVELLAKDGIILAAFQHQRVHEPMDGGGSSYRKSVELDPELLDAANKLICAMDYTGVAMIEFRKNPTTGDWIFIEINGRFWGSLPLAIASGADFPWYLYRMLTTGETDFVSSYKSGIYCRNLWLDAAWARENFKANRKGAHSNNLPWSKVLAETENVLRLRERSDTFVADDLSPGFVEVSRIFKMVWGEFSKTFIVGVHAISVVRVYERFRMKKTLSSARSILFVCKGNLYRSAFAEGCAKTAFPEKVSIMSAGHLDHGITAAVPKAVAAAAALGVDISAHKPKLINEDMINKADVVFVFDGENYRTLQKRFGRAKKKIFFIGTLSSGKNGICIDDPVDSSLEACKESFGVISSAINDLNEQIRKNHENSRNK